MGADDGAGDEALAAMLDEVIVATSALVGDLSKRGGPRERRIAAQLASALLALATARRGLAPPEEAPEGPRPTLLRASGGDHG